MKPNPMPVATENVSGMAMAVTTAGGVFSDIFPVEFRQPAGHQAGDKQQGRGRGVSWHCCCQWCQKQGAKKQDSDDNRRQAGSPAGLDTCGAFNIAGGCRRAQSSPGHGGDAVGHQGVSQSGQFALGIQQPSAMCNANQGACRIEQVDKQEGKDDGYQANFERAGDVHLQECRGEAWRCGDNAIKGGNAKRDTERGCAEDSDNNRPGNSEPVEGGHHDESGTGKDSSWLGKVTQRYEGCGMIDDNAGILERDDRQEKTNSGGYSHFERAGDRINNPFAYRQDTQDQEDYARQEDGTQRGFPAMVHALDDAVGEKGIQPHSRCQSDGIIGVEAHDKCADGRCEAGGNEYGALVHSGVREDQWIDEYDVGHGQESRDTGDDFIADRRAVTFQVKIAFDHVRPRGCASFPDWSDS